ncbi:sulfotransferase family protein [Psychroserpens mesophilus]|uniref:sulfotransferase family protein n=1 Tax=Psychroserpens mesophilus TaxID=325473 RepID=UPI003D65647F
MDNTQQLFIIGNPRSGTSLLRIMLNSHSSIVIPPECGFIHWWSKKYQNWNSKSSLAEFISDLQTSKKIETWQLDFDALASFLEIRQSTSYQELVFNIVDFYGQSVNQKSSSLVLGDKNNYYINHLQEIRSIAPNAKYLIIIRDPRDVYCSYKGIADLNSKSTYIPKLPQSVKSFTDDWSQNQSKIFKFLKKLNQKQFQVIHYEDLVLDSKLQLVKVCDFLDLPFEEKMLRYYETNDEPKALLEWKKKTLRPLDPTTIERYKKVLSSTEVETIESNTFDIYKQFKQSIK